MKTIKLNSKTFKWASDALIKLENYISEIKTYFESDKNYDKDVLEDITIALEEKLENILLDRANKKLIIEDIDNIIRQLWTVEMMMEEEDTNESKSKTKLQKKLFRDTKKWWIWWVCAGLAVYFDTPIRVARLLFFVLLFTPIPAMLLYIILRYLVKPAKTKSDELLMHWQTISISTLTQEDDYTKRRVIWLAKRFGIVVGSIILLILAAISTFVVVWSIMNGEDKTTYNYSCEDWSFVGFTEIYKNKSKAYISSQEIWGRYWIAPWINENQWRSNNLDITVDISSDKNLINVTQWDKVINKDCSLEYVYDSDGNTSLWKFTTEIKYFFNIDECLDEGNVWDYKQNICERCDGIDEVRDYENNTCLDTNQNN